MNDIESGGRPCPSCGKEAEGNFCRHCGTALGGRFCNKCGAPLAEGAKFCNQCGAPRAGAAAPAGETGATPGGAPAAPSTGPRSATGGPTFGTGGPAPKKTGAPSGVRRGGGASKGRETDSAAAGNLPWIVAGVSLFALILVVGFTMIQPGETTPTQPTAPFAGGAGGAAPDISQMTPREAADRLFDRVMRTLAAGDTAGAMAFQPMAVGAYERAEPLDLDGVFHMAMLEMLADPATALETTRRILDSEPDHVFALGIAAQAHAQMGRPEEARAAYQQLLDAYDAQALREDVYEGHLELLPSFRADAEAYLAGG